MEQVTDGSGRPFDLHDRAIVERCIGMPITTLDEAPGPRSTSYAVRRLMIDLADGRTLDVFHKDFDVSPHPPDVALSRGRRECFVYENILVGQGLGTPELYGAVWDDGYDRHWLLLEFVHGHKLRRDPADERIAAARWLGDLHRRIEGVVDQPGPLLSYDQPYFADTAKRAVSAVGARFEDLHRRLLAVLNDYEAIIARICSNERTLVHGSYRAKNIIVDASTEPVRICPADWELAAVGPRLHDLAFLADGCQPALTEQLCVSYAAAAGLQNFSADHMLRELNQLRMHKALRSLARSFEWNYPEATVAKLVARLERIRNHLG